ncbi:MAG TPA: L-threonine 3-dehydrogenase [Calditerricola sp.]|uniref:L-threonine 3-dehydrogenase n=1 Tax=Calditerricola satsumensis TaxID=373054 RepID=A0A8J3BBF0_9BACI|nr:L-threonine 3-dehydrogenase [Calditerricola satsumensis]GGJ95350.1 L-threonine 3-dehydrogenase [Calditerricola satsumensis]
MSGTMRAVVKTQAAPGAELRDVPIPKPGPGEALVQVKATTICGTDVHIYVWDDWAKSRIRVPQIIGHEFSGVVVDVGPGVTHVKVGDHVSAETHFVCGHCPQCLTGQAHICRDTRILGVDRDGCFAEYVVVPAQNLWKNDPALPFEVASLQEPMGNAVHTVLSGPVAGKTVAILGCGPIGIMAVAVARAAGAAKVFAVDVNPYRLELAKAMGAHVRIHAGEEDPVARVKEATGGSGVDVVCEMSGHPTAIRQGFKMLANGGRMAMLGLPTQEVPLDITNDIVFKGVTVQGITGRRMYETWQQTAGLLASGQVNLEPLITHRFPLERFAEAFELMKSGQCGKIVLIP